MKGGSRHGTDREEPEYRAVRTETGPTRGAQRQPGGERGLWRLFWAKESSERPLGDVLGE